MYSGLVILFCTGCVSLTVRIEELLAQRGQHKGPHDVLCCGMGSGHGVLCCECSCIRE